VQLPAVTSMLVRAVAIQDPAAAAVLARLALAAPSPVNEAALAALLGHDEVAALLQGLHDYLAAAAQQLPGGSANGVLREGNAWGLRLPQQAIDVLRFLAIADGAIRAQQAGDGDEASRLARLALGLWQRSFGDGDDLSPALQAMLRGTRTDLARLLGLAASATADGAATPGTTSRPGAGTAASPGTTAAEAGPGSTGGTTSGAGVSAAGVSGTGGSASGATGTAGTAGTAGSTSAAGGAGLVATGQGPSTAPLVTSDGQPILTPSGIVAPLLPNAAPAAPDAAGRTAPSAPPSAAPPGPVPTGPVGAAVPGDPTPVTAPTVPANPSGGVGGGGLPSAVPPAAAAAAAAAAEAVNTVAQPTGASLPPITQASVTPPPITPPSAGPATNVAAIAPPTHLAGLTPGLSVLAFLPTRVLDDPGAEALLASLPPSMGVTAVRPPAEGAAAIGPWAELARLALGAGHTRSVVVGRGAGVLAALAFARDNPEAVARLVLDPGMSPAIDVIPREATARASLTAASLALAAGVAASESERRVRNRRIPPGRGRLRDLLRKVFGTDLQDAVGGLTTLVLDRGGGGSAALADELTAFLPHADRGDPSRVGPWVSEANDEYAQDRHPTGGP